MYPDTPDYLPLTRGPLTITGAQQHPERPGWYDVQTSLGDVTACLGWEGTFAKPDAALSIVSAELARGIREEARQDEAFAVRDERSLEWYVDKQAALADKIDRTQAQARRMIAEAESEMRRLEFLYGAQAQGVARDLLAQKRKGSKTLRLLTGTLSFKTVAPKLKVTGEHDLIMHLLGSAEHADLVHTVCEIGEEFKTRFKVQDDGAVLDTTSGELITLPGVSTEGRRETFNIRREK